MTNGRGYAERGRGHAKGAWFRGAGVAPQYLCVTLMTSRARGPAPCAFPANRSAAAATRAGS